MALNRPGCETLAKVRTAQGLCLSGLLLAISAAPLRPQNNPPSPPPRASMSPGLPDAPGKQTVEKVCGTCHTTAMVLGRSSSREEWSEVISNMVAKGAKGTSAEFAQVLDYLAANLGPTQAPKGTAAPPKKSGGLTLGPDDKHV